MTPTDKTVADDMETMKLRLDLGELDREWMEEKERHGPADGLTVLGRVGLGVAGVLILGSGVVIATRATWGEAAWAALFIPLGIFYTGSSVLELRRIFQSNEAYNRAKENYETRRQELLRKFEAAEATANTEEENDEPED